MNLSLFPYIKRSKGQKYLTDCITHSNPFENLFLEICLYLCYFTFYLIFNRIPYSVYIELTLKRVFRNIRNLIP